MNTHTFPACGATPHTTAAVVVDQALDLGGTRDFAVNGGHPFGGSTLAPLDHLDQARKDTPLVVSHCWKTSMPHTASGGTADNAKGRI